MDAPITTSCNTAWMTRLERMGCQPRSNPLQRVPVTLSVRRLSTHDIRRNQSATCREQASCLGRGLRDVAVRFRANRYARDPRRSKLCEGHLLFYGSFLEGSLVPSSASPPPSVSRVPSPLVSSSGSPLGLSDSPSGTSLFFISLVLFELMLLSGFLYRAQATN